MWRSSALNVGICLRLIVCRTVGRICGTFSQSLIGEAFREQRNAAQKTAIENAARKLIARRRQEVKITKNLWCKGGRRNKNGLNEDYHLIMRMPRRFRAAQNKSKLSVCASRGRRIRTQRSDW